MEQQKQPSGFPTRESLVAAFDEMLNEYETDVVFADSDAFPERASELCAAATLCGYITFDEQRAIDKAFQVRVRAGEDVKLVELQRVMRATVEGAGAPSDTPKPVTYNRTEELRSGFAGQFAALIGTVRKMGVIPRWCVIGGVQSSLVAVIMGFLTYEDVRRAVEETQPEIGPGKGTPESFIALYERVQQMVAESTLRAPEFVEVTADGPKDEYPQTTAPLDAQTSVLASAMFGGTHHNTRRSRSNSPVA